MHSMDDLMIRYGAIAWEKQLFLSEQLGENPPSWQFTMSDGKLRFEDKFAFDIQLLGTESEATQTFLWAWSNDASNIPDALLTAANELKKKLADDEIFTNADPFPTNEQTNGHRLAMIASTVLGANAYYRGPYEGGALYMLIFDDAFPQDTRKPIQRIATGFAQFIQSVQIFDHKQALRYYAQAHQLNISTSEEGKHLILEQADGERLQASFDVQNRLTQITTITKKD